MIDDPFNAFCRDSEACLAGATEGLPVGLSLLGARGTDELLIGFGREIVAAQNRSSQ